MPVTASPVTQSAPEKAGLPLPQGDASPPSPVGARRARVARSELPMPPPLQPLLPWQSYALCWLLGLTACRWPWAAGLGALLLLWVDSRLWKPAPLLLALALWLLGVGVNVHEMPQRGPLPPWAHTERGTPPPRLEGIVDSVQGLPDQRLRVILRLVRPVDMPAENSLHTADASFLLLPHLVQWTWDKPARFPVEGQRVRLSLPLRDTVGFRNEGVEDFGEYWLARKVLWRLWSREQGGLPEWLGQGELQAQSRHAQRQKLTAVLSALHTSDAPATASEIIPVENALPPATSSPAFSAATPFMTQAQAFLPALLFGDRQYLDSATVEHMTAASLVHSLALSGQHLALAALCGTLLACGAGFLFPAFYLRVPRRKLMALCSLLPAMLYVWLGGAPFSLVRAFVMLAVLALLLWRNQPRTLADLLLTALVVITVAQPLAVFDVGLQLSALCVGSMALALPLLRRTARRLWPPPLPSARDPLSTHLWKPRRRPPLHTLLRALFLAGGVSLAIQLALAPLLLLRFGQISPWFPLNMLWLPVLGLWVLPLAALGQALLAAGLGEAAHYALMAAAWPCGLLLQGLDVLARHGLLEFPAVLRPHWTSLAGWTALMIALALLPGRWQDLCAQTSALRPALLRLTAAACLLLAVGPLLRVYHALLAPPQLEMLDVGQGQALRLILPGGQQILMDGGGNLSPRFDPGEALVLPRITHNAAPRLFAVVNSHPDADHWRGLRHILQKLPVVHFFHNGDAYPAEDAALLGSLPIWAQGKPLHAGMVLPLPSHRGDLRLEVLHPPAGRTFTDNNNSLVLRLVRDGHGLALFTGDAEIPALRHLLASGQDLRADVLVLPHHGSRRSLLPEFYDAVAPRLALASCGRHNRFGFPAQDVREALRQRGIPLRSTDEEGAISVDW